MAKGKKNVPARKVDEVQEECSSEYPLQKINIYDSGAVKHCLDESARQVILDSGFDEDHTVGNVKIVLGFLSIGTALLAHLLPGKFPSNRTYLLICVIVYFVLTTVLAIYATRAEGDAVLLTRKDSGDLRLSSQMARFSTDYVITLESRSATGGVCHSKSKNAGVKDNGGDSKKLQRTYDVARFFHSDGYLSEEAWREEVTALLIGFFSQAPSSAGKPSKAK